MVKWDLGHLTPHTLFKMLQVHFQNPVYQPVVQGVTSAPFLTEMEGTKIQHSDEPFARRVTFCGRVQNQTRGRTD